MHTGDRSADAIDAGRVLPGYEGVIVRDGYAGYGHLTSALHAWCGVHLLRDLKGLHDFEPSRQQWASQMAALLIEARDAAGAARQAGQSVLDAAVWIHDPAERSSGDQYPGARLRRASRGDRLGPGHGTGSPG